MEDVTIIFPNGCKVVCSVKSAKYLLIGFGVDSDTFKRAEVHGKTEKPAEE